MAENESALRDELFYNQKQGYDLIDVQERLKLEAYCEDYKAFLNASRTEREAVAEGIRQAEAVGFVPYVRGMDLQPGAKVYKSIRGKAIMLAVMGKKPLDRGVNIAAAHVDSPRLDLKQLPLFEKNELAYFKTHYYGGIKKYQWLTIPLELHGVVTKKDGETVEVVIGKDPEDPKFVITDLLPHLAKDQLAKSAVEFVPGENLNLLIGSIPYADEGKDRIKLAVLSLLKDRYDITEEDFLSAELEAVPSFPACDVGVDRSFIGGYGHDDRVCAYAELKAIYETEAPERTAVCILADKEEIGSVGVSGMQSAAFETFLQDLCAGQGVHLRHCLENSFCVSADVCNAYDPTFWEAHEYPNRNGARINYGVGLCKYTGARGKSGCNDASAEVVGTLRRIFADNAVVWQMAKLGKVDQGGGGTVAADMGNRNIDTIDAGVPVLSMHAPWETVATLDCYMTYKGIRAFYKDR
ncbi:MAG: aminopeptidase [Oscillospiraceae bacterium]|nr:aminopeptidase [Oscillospiraceae bacterium]